MAEYKRPKFFSFVDNTNPNLGLVVDVSDYAITCDYWTEPDPVTGEPIQKEWCPLVDGYDTFKHRLADELGILAHNHPNQTMIYFRKSAALQAAYDAATDQNKYSIKVMAWNTYDSVWTDNPNLVGKSIPGKPATK